MCPAYITYLGDCAHHVQYQPNYVHYQIYSDVEFEELHLVSNRGFSEELFILINFSRHSFTYP
jgi:hypothetical protein